jgi:hypothetical protein
MVQTHQNFVPAHLVQEAVYGLLRDSSAALDTLETQVRQYAQDTAFVRRLRDEQGGIDANALLPSQRQ